MAASSSVVKEYSAPLWKQIVVIMQRSTMIGVRDVTLYWLQLILAAGFAFLVGLVFWQIPMQIGPRLQDLSNGIVWLTLVASYLQVFKIYYLFTTKQRIHDEHLNHYYSIPAWFIADLVVTSFFTFIMFVPALLIGYGMMGLPDAAIGYTIFALFITALSSESLMELLCQMTMDLPTAILLGQGTLVILCVFAGGAFILWSKLGFWIWLSDISLYTYATRGILIAVYKHVTYSCPNDLVIADRTSCQYNLVDYPCDAGNVGGQCLISGSSVLKGYKDVSETDEWFQLGMLIVLTAAFRLLTALLLQWPMSHLYRRLISIVGRPQRCAGGK